MNNSLKNFEITGQLSGQVISKKTIQSTQNIVLGIQQDIGLLVLAQNPISLDQSAAEKAVEIMLDDMSYNLSSQLEHGNLQQNFVSNCLHESLENINEFLIEQNQLSKDDYSIKGISISAIQINNKNISCCMHGDLSAYKLSNGSFNRLGSKVTMTKALGINPSLNFNIEEQAIQVNDIIILADYSLIEQLGIEFVRMTLSRFGENLYMAIRQINARASKRNITQDISFLLCRKINDAKVNKKWF